MPVSTRKPALLSVSAIQAQAFSSSKTKLGMGVNPMAQGNQVILSLGESFLRAGLRIHKVLLILFLFKLPHMQPETLL